MKKVSFTKFLGGVFGGLEPASAQMWRPLDRPYPRIMEVDIAVEGLVGQPGIYAIWHLGVRPQWLRVGATLNLGVTLSQLAHVRWIVAHKDNNGVFAAWAFRPQEQSAGLVRYLAETLSPAYQGEPIPGDLVLDPDVPSVVCPLPPGTQT